ncbi:MAG TPA: DUF998 domain-containing protein [Actinomycetota bacterium]|nr:DUF998 domain-containing protein [Actinomycetota bacterium]
MRRRSPAVRPEPRPDGSTRLLALGGVVGPAAFVAAWAIGGARAVGYSPVEDAISRLAAVGAPTRPGMTAGFITFGVGVPLYGLALRRVLPGPAWAFAVATGLATLAVAALPLDAGVDEAHGVAAGLGYATLAGVPLSAAPYLQGRRATAAALAAGAATAGLLIATLGGGRHGLLQRSGLAATDVWIAVTAAKLAVRARLESPGG